MIHNWETRILKLWPGVFSYVYWLCYSVSFKVVLVLACRNTAFHQLMTLQESVLYVHVVKRYKTVRKNRKASHATNPQILQINVLSQAYVAHQSILHQYNLTKSTSTNMLF